MEKIEISAIDYANASINHLANSRHSLQMITDFIQFLVASKQISTTYKAAVEELDDFLGESAKAMLIVQEMLESGEFVREIEIPEEDEPEASEEVA